MLTLLVKLASAKWMRYVWGVIAVGLLSYSLYFYGYHKGSAAKEIEYQAVIAEEQLRLAKEKRDAINDAAKRIEHLEMVISVRDATVERLINEAAEDPNSGNDAISDDSVRRLNRVR